MSKSKPIQTTQQARAAFVDLVAALDLKNVDAGAIFDAVQARGFKHKARAFSVNLAAAALVDGGFTVDDAIDAAVVYLDARLAALGTPPEEGS